MFYESQIEEKENTIKGLEDKVRQRNEELAEKKQDAELKIAAEKRRQVDFEIEMEESKNKLEVVRNKIQEITNQNKVLSERIDARNKEVQDKSCLKEDLATQAEELGSEISYLQKKEKLLVEELSKIYPRAKKKGQPNQSSGSRRGSTNQKYPYSNTSSLTSDPGAKRPGGKKISQKPDSLVRSSTARRKAENIKPDGGCSRCIIF